MGVDTWGDRDSANESLDLQLVACKISKPCIQVHLSATLQMQSRTRYTIPCAKIQN